jgi:hypothetical protein
MTPKDMPTTTTAGDFTDEIAVGSLEDYAYGSIIGAFTGDACGSYNEFCKYVQTNDRFMDDCMTMPGGGPFRLAPG